MLSSKLISNGSRILRENIKSHLLDSELIMSKLLKKSREKLLVSDSLKVSKEKINKFSNLINRRLNHEPIAYILNKKEFWSRDFYINKHTLIPRPETELLVEKIVQIYKNTSPYILDIGTGSGCILISILEELKKAKGIGIDISIGAINVAKKNCLNSYAKKRMKFIHKSLNGSFSQKFDLIVSNPPYICTNDIKNLSKDIKNFEPKIALDGGNDGLDVIKKVIYKSKSILKKNGLLALEIGNKQYLKVSKILRNNNFREKYLIRDYRRNIRSLIFELMR